MRFGRTLEIGQVRAFTGKLKKNNATYFQPCCAQHWFCGQLAATCAWQEFPLGTFGLANKLAKKMKTQNVEQRN